MFSFKKNYPKNLCLFKKKIVCLKNSFLSKKINFRSFLSFISWKLSEKYVYYQKILILCKIHCYNFLIVLENFLNERKKNRQFSERKKKIPTKNDELNKNSYSGSHKMQSRRDEKKARESKWSAVGIVHCTKVYTQL